MSAKDYVDHRGSPYMTIPHTTWLWYLKHVKLNTGTAK